MAVSVSVVINSVPGFEFVIIGPRLLTRATPDPAFEARRKTDVFQRVCYTILIWFSVRFFGAIKDASETTWPLDNKKSPWTGAGSYRYLSDPR